jgi:hypothetical protein
VSLQFVSVVREGLSARLPVADTGVGSPALATTTMATALKLQASATLGTQTSPAVPVQVLGAADVSGLDPRLVLRTDPPEGAQRFDIAQFALIEFDLPGLPWMFTPLAQVGEKLRPWIALVVLERKSETDPLDTGPVARGRLPVLRVPSADDLPPAAETWAWAHAQVAVDGTPSAAALGALMTGQPETALSRLLCPRRLEPGTHYVACVVPTFNAGRTAGLGQAPDTTVAPAWTAASKFPLELPVYHHWTFFTGDADNFERAVRRLRRASAPVQVGRVIDASKPGRSQVEDAGAAALPFAGALRPPDLTIDPYTGPAVQGYAQLASAGGVVTAPSGRQYPVVDLPIYAGKHVGATDVVSAPVWVRELNTDPRHRVAAALGAQIVRANQEALMTAAWEQVGDIEEANRLLRLARLAREASKRIVARHIEPLDDLRRLGVLAPAFARLALDGPKRTVAGLIADSRVPALSLGPSYTALLRPGGKIARKLLPVPADAATVPGGIDAGQLEPDRGIDARPGGLVTLDGVLAVVDAARDSVRGGGGRAPVAAPGLTPTAPSAARVTVRAEGTTRTATRIRLTDSTGFVGPPRSTTMGGTFALPTGAALRRIEPGRLTPDVMRDLPGTLTLDVSGSAIDVTAAHKIALQDLFSEVEPAPEGPKGKLGIAQVAGQAFAAIDPETTIVQAVLAGITVPSAVAPADPLDDVLAAPRFPAPLAPDLIRLSPDMVLPGLEEVQPDTVFAVLTHDAFVQALLAGANHEMMRELRWRGFPTDERGTVFHRFWRDDTDEIADLHTIKTGALGAAISGGVNDVVVVVRSELLNRFPGTQVFAVPAVTAGASTQPDFTKPELPLFRGVIASDVAFFGFGFSEATATRSPGRFLVFQQPAGAPAFGLDLDARKPGFPSAVNDLAFEHVTMSGDHVRAEVLGPAFDNGATWGASAADQAASTLQQPMRAAVHFRDLLGKP